MFLGSYAAGVAALFVYMHTGGRVQDACKTHHMNAAEGGLSLSPLGVRCSGALPTSEGTYVAQDFKVFAVASGMLVLLAALAIVISGYRHARRFRIEARAAASLAVALPRSSSTEDGDREQRTEADDRD